MKITLLTPALVAVLGLALAGAPLTTQAQTPAPSTAPAMPTPAKPKPTQYKGSLTAVDATSITVTTKTGPLMMATTAATKYQKDGKKATIADFAVGDNVTGSYTKDSTGVLTAYSLHKKTATAAAPKTPATPAAPTTAPATAPMQ